MYGTITNLKFCLVLLLYSCYSFRLTFFTDPTLSRRQLDHSSFLDVLKSDQALFVPTFRSKSYFRPSKNDDSLHAVFLNSSDIDIDRHLKNSEAFIYLGSDPDGTDYIAVEVTQLHGSLQVIDLDASIQCDNLRNIADSLNAKEAALLAYARGMSIFHLSNPFCSSCGSKSYSQKCGRSRKCATCQTSVYPRIEPAAIMLVTRWRFLFFGFYCIILKQVLIVSNIFNEKPLPKVLCTGPEIYVAAG